MSVLEVNAPSDRPSAAASSETGAGVRPPVIYPRLGAPDITAIGLKRNWWNDAYHRLLTVPFGVFMALMAALFLTINTAFALLYMLDEGGITNARPGSFQDAFFFSVQTLGTLGYGVMAPKSLAANLTATLETFVGLFNLAVATGLLFARISRPTARIMFSRRSVITLLEGVPTLMFRAANQRRNLVIEAEVTVTLVLDITTSEGVLLRRFYDLQVLRSRSPLFFLSWQVMHPITPDSPLFGETMESLLLKRAEILVIVKGIDDTFVQTIHARTSYLPDEIVWQAKLADIFTVDDKGRRAIDYRRFHDVEVLGT